jgi:hypothetical protein
MGLTAKDSGGDFELPPQGTHPATCCAIIDLGTQYSEKWKKHAHKVLLGWELGTDDKRNDGQAHAVWQRFTVSLHAKAGLRRVLEAWRGRSFTAEELSGFDLKNVAGKGCIITVMHKDVEGKTYANIASVSALPRQMTAPVLAKAPTLFDIDKPDMDVFNAFSEKLQELIKSSAEWKSSTGTGAADGPPPLGDDDIPF